MLCFNVESITNTTDDDIHNIKNEKEENNELKLNKNRNEEKDKIFQKFSKIHFTLIITNRTMFFFNHLWNIPTKITNMCVYYGEYDFFHI